jgi:hypothetical protein
MTTPSTAAPPDDRSDDCDGARPDLPRPEGGEEPDRDRRNDRVLLARQDEADMVDGLEPAHDRSARRALSGLPAGLFGLGARVLEVTLDLGDGSAVQAGAVWHVLADG